MAQAPYCSATADDCSTWGDYIDAVSVANVDRTNSGCSSGSYEHYTADTIVILKQLPYTLTVTSGPWQEGFRAWLDFDNDTGFGDPGEDLGGGLPPQGTPTDINFTVPSSANVGITRLRVRGLAFATPSTADSCGDIGDFGETEDYVVDIQPAPSCIPPTNVSVSAIGSDSAIVDWTANNSGGNNWDIEYGPSGFTQGNGTLVNTTNNPFELTGLTPATSYDIYVREWCNASDSSMWSGPITFTTSCGMLTAPYFQDFDDPSWTPGSGFDNSGDAISTCWTRDPVDQGSDYAWGTRDGQTGSSNNGPDGDYPGGTGNYIFTEGSSGGPGDIAYIESPSIDLSGLTNVPALRYYSFLFVNDNYMEEFYVAVNDVNSSAGWVKMDSITQQIQSDESDPWEQRELYLIPFENDTVKVRFYGISGGTYADYAFDSLSITEGPSCTPPNNLNVTNVGTDSATLSWSNHNGPNNSWEVEYGPTGFTQGNGTTVTTVDTSHKLTGLSLGTEYQFYVREWCSASDSSYWSGPFTFTTDCGVFPSPYTETFDINGLPSCWGASILGSNGWQFGQQGDPAYGASNASEHTGNGGYFAWVDYSNVSEAELISPKVYVGNLSAPEVSFWLFSHNTDEPGDNNTIRVEAYDGSVWKTLGEVQSGDPDWRQFRFFLGEDVRFNDTVQVRIVADENTNIIAYENDQLIDDFRIGNAPPNNMACADLLFPQSGTHCELDDSTQVRARFRNEGSSIVDSFQVGYSVNGIAPIVETIHQTLMPGEDTIYEFEPTGLMNANLDYEVATFTMLNGDTLQYNDTARSDVTVDGSGIRPEPELGADTTICWEEEEIALDPGFDSTWSYMWSNGSTTQTKYVVTEFLDTNTTYTYTVTVSNNQTSSLCSATDSMNVTVKNCTRTSIAEHGNGDAGFSIRPNPASDRVFIESEDFEGSFRYQLLDLQGRTVSSRSSNGRQRSSLDVSELSKGVYILRGERSGNGKPLFRKKVVVE